MTLCGKDGDANESTRNRGRHKRRWLDRVMDDIKEKTLSAEEVYDRATWKRVIIVHRPHIKVGIGGRRFGECFEIAEHVLVSTEIMHLLLH